MSFNDLEAGGSGTALPEINDKKKFANLSNQIAQSIHSISSHSIRLKKILNSIDKSDVDPSESNKKLNVVSDQLDQVRDQIKEATANLKHMNAFFAQISSTKTGETKSLKQIEHSVDFETAKYTQKKLNKDFREALSKFQNVQKQAADLEKELVEKTKFFQKQQKSIANDAVLMESEDHTPKGDDDDNNNVTASGQTVQLLDEEEIQFSERIIAQREADIRDIEHGITELNEIFKDLGSIVVEQGEHIDNIEANISNTTTHVINADEELDRANRYHKGAKKRAFWLTLILSCIILLMVLAIIS